MKLNKLYTLSDFIEVVMFYDNALELILGYNEFLKQPLKKEMFVNEIKDNLFEKGIIPESRMEEWREAEKKVIFENAKANNCKIQNVMEVHYFIPSNIKEGFIIIYNENSDRFFNIGSQLITLSELAEKTNGELELKNFEL